MKDFDDYLRSNTNHLKTALTDKSFRKATNDPTLPVNNDLGTLGDAVLRLVLTEQLFDHDQISNDRQDFEKDEYLVKTVAKHYRLLEILQFDKNDSKMGHDYNWEKCKNGNPRKFIATAMEALLGAYYLDRNCDLALMRKLVNEWTQLPQE